MGKGFKKDIFVIECGSSKKGCSKYMTHWFWDPFYRGRYYGFNRGLQIVRRKATYKYYWFLVNDIIFAKGQDVLGELVKVMEENPRMGVIGPGEPYAKDYLGCFPKPGRRWHKVSTVHGLAFLMRKKAVEEAGFCNPRFRYSQGAGTELAYKLYKKGWFLAYSDRTTVKHLGGSTYGKTVKISRHEYFRRSRIFALKYLEKHYGKDWEKLFTQTLPPEVEENTFVWQKKVWGKKLKKEPGLLSQFARSVISNLKKKISYRFKSFRKKHNENTAYK